MKNLTVAGPSGTLSTMLSTNPNFCSGGCTLKFNLVNKLQNADNQAIPYLEYRIRNGTTLGVANWDNCFLKYPPLNTCSVSLNLNGPIALPFTTVSSEGVAYGYRRTNSRNLQQLTTSEELDFAVFQ